MAVQLARPRPASHSGNNWPLRGGKTNFIEGGVRVTSFVTDGALPAAVRGPTREEYVSVADWYPTLIGLSRARPLRRWWGDPGGG